MEIVRTQGGAKIARNRRCCGTQAQPDAPRRLGLVLGGGGGKGGAHLGVLAVLEELGVPIDIIVGTSVGALGVMYAAGVSLADLERFFRQTELRRIAAADPLRAGLIGPRKREALTVELLGERTFADLSIPCAVVAVDLVSGREVVIDQGPLVPALLATSAIPGVFPPVVRGDELLVDGGLLNNLPVDVARRMGAQRIIAVQLSEDLPGFALPTDPAAAVTRLTHWPRHLAVLKRSLDVLMAQADLRPLQHVPALLLRPDVRHIATLDMTHPEEGRRAGEHTASAAAAELLALREWRLSRSPSEQGQRRSRATSSVSAQV
jgi:NTE family protein